MFRFCLLPALLLSGISLNFIHAQTPCDRANARTVLDANNARVNLSHLSYFWTKIDTQFGDPDNFEMSAGYEIPKLPEGSGNDVHSIFSGGFWIGALDKDDSIRLSRTIYEYEIENFWAGPLNSNGKTDLSICNAYDKYWETSDTEVQKQINNYRFSNYQDIPLANIPESVLKWPARGNPYAKGKNGQSITINEELAPFVDVDSNGVYNPVKGDFPDIRGDQHIFWVFNDKGDTSHPFFDHNPLGIEIHANAYAYSSNNTAIDNATYYSFKFLAKDTIELREMNIGIFVDIDLGCFNNDFVGCDTSRDMGIGYNGTATDPDCASKGYGANPPITGIKILKGPKDNNGDRMGMSVFKYYNGDFSVMGTPSSKEDLYNYIRGFWKDNTTQTIGGNGYGGNVPTNFMFSGNPANPNEWSECSENNTPADRRFIMSVGPMDFMPGEVKTMDIAVVWTRPDSFHCGDFNSTIGAAADQVQAFCDSVIDVPKEVPVVSSINENMKGDPFSVFPNPFDQNIRVQVNKPIENAHLTLLDISGKSLKSHTFSNLDTQIEIQTSEIPPCIYFLNLFENGKSVGVKKLIKTEP
ncbi:MAG: T9SS type A sorting domain-containing protein [Chitinophagales bacterium]